MEGNYITEISNKEKQIIKNKTAYGLPDRPSNSGMKPAEIKKAFWSPIIDETDDTSVLGIIERVIREANEAFSEADNKITYGETDLEDGVSPLETGKIYFYVGEE